MSDLSNHALPAGPTSPAKSLAKGLLAGLVGGLAGTVAKGLAEKLFPPRTHGEPEPPRELAQQVAGGALTPATQAAAGEAIHWSFGALAGAAYGGVVEYFPVAASKQGATFGIALGTLTHEGALPALRLAASPARQSERQKASELTSHVVYGITTEIVRGLIRRIL